MDLQRFVDAQAGTYEQAVGELRQGRKTSHWMWWVFPQVAGLGMSSISQQYAVRDLAEATAYVHHDVLGPRLLECCRALLDLDGLSAEQVLGTIDAIKLRSSMTLFAHADPSEPVFREVLERFYDGQEDERTVTLLG
jgi:uncharacterized protein (DUF1810 family)